MTTAIVVNDNGTTYESPILAFKNNGMKTQVIGFNQSFDKIELINMWGSASDSIRRNVFIVENDFGTECDDWVGFDCVINNENLFVDLQSNGSAGIEKYPVLKKFCKRIILPSAFEVKTDKDINALMDVSFGFHDSSICEYAENENSIAVRFDTTWGCYITVIFEGVIAEEFKERVGLILYSEIAKTADGFSFTVKEGYPGWIDRCDYAGYADFGEPYIKCKKIHWQIEVVYE